MRRLRRPVLFALLLAASRLARGDEEHRTPRAGEAASGTLFGKTVSAPERDRSRITYLNVGAVLLPGGPEEKEFGPMGGLYLWRVPADGTSRLRGIIAIISNEVRWDRALPGLGGLSLVLTFDSLTPWWARSEYVTGVRIAAGELKWNQARGGVGFAFRKSLPPGACDNGLDAALTYEPGGLWFLRGSDTAPDYVVPVDTYEGRLHLRLRADALERNLLEMPHRGWSAGLDGLAGWRARWEPWGFPALPETGGRDWQAVSGFALGAFAPFPGLSERHRLIASLHAGAGSDLDRFSAFRLGGGSTWGDFETLSRIVLPGAGVDEVFSSRYAIVDLEYRWEALFFLYLQLRGTLAWADRIVPVAGGTATRTGSFPALTAGLTSGLPWDLSLEFAASWNFGLERVTDGRPEKGSFGLLFSLTKEF